MYEVLNLIAYQSPCHGFNCPIRLKFAAIIIKANVELVHSVRFDILNRHLNRRGQHLHWLGNVDNWQMYYNKCPMIVTELSNVSEMSVTWPLGIDRASSWSWISAAIADQWSMVARSQMDTWLGTNDWSYDGLDFQATASEMSGQQVR